MKTTDRDVARRILSEIDTLSDSAAMMKDTIEHLTKAGGSAKLIVYTDGESIITELGEAGAISAMREIIGIYNNEITVRKSSLEAIVRKTIVELS